MDSTVYEELKRIFHEPKRMAIMSALCAADRKGLTFTELKRGCGMSDGNLNRHLKVLADSGAVRIEKKFVGVKPRTTVFLTERGLDRFSEYLEALRVALENSLAAMPETRKTTSVQGSAVVAR